MIAQGKDPVAIERERVEKAKSKRKGGGFMAKMQAAAAQQQPSSLPAPKQTISRSVTERKPVTRVDVESGKQVVIRQQPSKKSRAKRKH